MLGKKSLLVCATIGMLCIAQGISQSASAGPFGIFGRCRGNACASKQHARNAAKPMSDRYDCNGTRCKLKPTHSEHSQNNVDDSQRIVVTVSELQQFAIAEYCEATFETSPEKVVVIYWLSTETNEFGTNKIVAVGNYSPDHVVFDGETITAKNPTVASGKLRDTQRAEKAKHLPYDILVKESGRQEIVKRNG
jgi:hypothetical protein